MSPQFAAELAEPHISLLKSTTMLGLYQQCS
jgi:hypothetical protein